MTDEVSEGLVTKTTAPELTPIQLDHSYAKPWNWRQESAHCKPARTLFGEPTPPVFPSITEQVDVETETVEKNPSILNFDLTEKSCLESEQKLLSLSCDDKSEDWEESIKRDSWTPLQHRIFNKVVKVLTAYKLSRQASEKWNHEIIQKKIYNESAAKKLRIILSSVSWDTKVTQWLHLTLIENLSREYLMCYIGILQVLRSKVPTLVDRMLSTLLVNNRSSPLNTQIMNYVVEKPWEPTLVHNVSSSKFPVAPLIVMVPSGTCSGTTSPSSLSGSRRFQTWQTLLQSLGRVFTISLHPTIVSPQSLPLPLLVESIIGATIQKVQELKSTNPGRPIILAGLQQGSLIAAQVAYLEPVSALLCLGFPLFTVDGKRGEPDDFILDIKAPTMIVIGQSSSTCTVDAIEQLRHRMKAESSLLVVDGATDSLRMLRFKKRQQNVTQSMVDASILEEISTFVSSVVSPVGSDRKNHSAKSDSSAFPGSGPSKRVRLSTDADDSSHAALIGHNYSQNALFAQPSKGRSGTGLSRVRGGRAGFQSRTSHQRSASSDTPTKGRSRSVHQSPSGGSPHELPRSQRGTLSSSRRSSPTFPEVENEPKSNVSSIQGSPKDENPSSVPSSAAEGKGGDSSETESAPPADDEEEILEDLRFCNELLQKMQQNQASSSTPPTDAAHRDKDSDASLQFSGDEGDSPLAKVRHRLSVENK